MNANRKYLAFSSPDPPPTTSSRTLVPSTEGSWHGWGGVGGQCCTKGCQGSYPFSETNFQDFSRTQIDFSTALKFTLTPHSQDLNVNSPYCLPYTSYFLVELNRFPGPVAFFQDLCEPWDVSCTKPFTLSIYCNVLLLCFSG